MNAAYKNIFKAVTLFGSVQGLNIVINLVRTKLVAVLLGPAGVGLNSIYTETRELIHETTNCGMDQSGIREISIAYEEWQNTGDRTRMDHAIKLTRSLILMFSIVGVLFCALFSWLLSDMTFGDYDHTLAYLFLAPAVGLSTLICGEMTVLKATRQLKSIATLSTVNLVLGTIATIPLYYLYGMEGIIPAIYAMLIIQLLLVVNVSVRSNPLSISLQKSFLMLGKPMVVLGGAFVLQGIIAHGAKLVIKSYINTTGGLDDVGYFNALVMIISTYLGLFASSLAVDYYPRLSGIFADKQQRLLTVRRQIDVLQLFTAPMIVLFIICAHIVVPLLLSEEFLPVVPALELGLVTCLVRTISQPMAFTPLAAGDSKTYLFVDVVDLGLMAVIYVLCYKMWGLMGLGYGVFIYNIFECTWVSSYARVVYGVSPSRHNMLFFFLQTILIIAAYLVVRFTEGYSYWALGAVLVALSVSGSLLLFRKISSYE